MCTTSPTHSRTYSKPTPLHGPVRAQPLPRTRQRRRHHCTSTASKQHSRVQRTQTSPCSVNLNATVRSIALQSLLHTGSRPFSYVFNAIERYLSLLRSITSAEAKAGILSAAAAFWKGNCQMVGIVFVKLMQYQIVDPMYVVVWTFANHAPVPSMHGASTSGAGTT
ncbi:hypothetical protein D9615_005526 [Tricholomella constricta]|uniref:MIF4G-like type 2 domain-containing protein n=1 Tax=Tricholomella constricta TaxID=117010 RepID=A0A8H5HEJ6_9AGAR|nr:hypothetical protein D9615_005526 [Tricholomella constricta]